MSHQRSMYVLMGLLVFFIVGVIPNNHEEEGSRSHQAGGGGGRSIGILAVEGKGLPGVPAEQVEQYRPSAATPLFACDGGATKIPFEKINDNYCDCLVDGRDEPSTSACSGIGQDHYFFCRNVGHEAKNIHPMFVNDGICDCCDGTDEWFTGVCKPNCLEQLRKQQEERRQLIDLHEKGAALKRAWEARATEQLLAKREELNRLRNDVLPAAESKLQQALDLWQQEQQAIQEQEAAEQLELQKNMPRPSHFLSDDDGLFDDPPLDDDLPLRSDPVPGLDDEDEDDEDEDEDDDEDADNKVAKPAKNEPEHIVKLRKEVEQVTSAISELDSLLSLNFGPGDALFNLHGTSHTVRAESYQYVVAHYDNAKQDRTSLGKFNALTVLEDGRIQMSYSGGQGCWGGPDRSATVEFQCGLQTALVSVEEVSKCTYHFVMQSFVACDSQVALRVRNEYDEIRRQVQSALQEAKELTDLQL